jgi:hypothetical protein
LLVALQLASASVGPTSGFAGNVTLAVQHDGSPKETSWKLSRGSRVIAQQRLYGVVSPYKLVTKTFNLRPGLYRFRIWDSAGDGLCCQYGQGYWEVYNTDSGSTSAIYTSTGTFASNEEIYFRLY